MNKRYSKALVNIYKNGLKSERKELLDLAIEKGFNLSQHVEDLVDYCENEIFNFNILEFICHKTYTENIEETEYLIINNTDFDGFKNLTSLKKLEDITLNNCNITSFNLIDQFPNLESITINNPNFEKFNILEAVDFITCLNFRCARIE